MTGPVVFTGNDSGSNGRCIIYRSSPGEKPVLNGGILITNWTLADANKNIWKAAVPPGTAFRQLFVNGNKRTLARSVDGLGLSPTSTGYSSANSTVRGLSDSPSAANLEVVIWPRPWNLCILPVASVSSTGAVRIQQPAWSLVYNTEIGAQNFPYQLWMQNAYEFLVNPGDWYLRSTSNTVYYIPQAGEDLATATIEAPVLEQIIKLAGTSANPVSHLRFEGLSFEMTTWLLAGKGYGTASAQANQPQPTPPVRWSVKAALDGSWVRYVDVSQCIFLNLGGNGVNLGDGSRNDVVDHCQFYNLSAGAIQVSQGYPPLEGRGAADPGIVSDIVVANNTIHNTGVDYPMACAIFFGFARNSAILHNELYDLTYSGISLGWGWSTAGPSYPTGNFIHGNLIHRPVAVPFQGTQLSDGGAIYVNSLEQHATLSENYAYGQGASTSDIYLDDGGSNWSVFRNVVRQDAAPFWLTYKGSNNHIYDNYTDVGTVLAATTGPLPSTLDTTTIVPGANWPPAAREIVRAAGPDPMTHFSAAASVPLSTTTNGWAAGGPPASQAGIGFGNYRDDATPPGTSTLVFNANQAHPGATLSTTFNAEAGHVYALSYSQATEGTAENQILQVDILETNYSIALGASSTWVPGLYSRYLKIFTAHFSGVTTIRFADGTRGPGGRGVRFAVGSEQLRTADDGTIRPYEEGTNYVHFTHLVPDPNGNLIITCTTPSGANGQIEGLQFQVVQNLYAPFTWVSQPVGTTVQNGTTALFKAAVGGGSGSYSYQWYENGLLMPGQTGSSLSLAKTTTAENGFVYSVVFDDGWTQMTCSPVILRVIDAGQAPVDQLSVKPQVAYALRVLNASHIGNAVQVRRDSDNATMDVGFGADGWLDTAALLNFVGPGNGYISVWYDQSGNGHDVTQIALNQQPQLVNRGAVNLFNGRPALFFSGSQFLVANGQSWQNGTPYTYSAVCETEPFHVGGVYHPILSFSTAGWLMSSGSSGTLDLGNWGDDGYYAVSSDRALHIYSAIKPILAGSTLFRDGVSIGSIAQPSNLIGNQNSLSIGAANQGAWTFVGNISELAVFSAALSSEDRRLLAANQGTSYQIRSANLAYISTQPTNVAALPGGSASFSVGVQGMLSPSYQWYQNGSRIPGSTNATLLMTNISGAMNGDPFYAVVSGSGTNLMSTTASLTVLTLSASVTPLNPVVTNGSTVVFTAITDRAVGPLNYQWLRDGTNVPGQTGPVLTLTNLPIAESGHAYSFVVHDAFTQAVSAPSSLEVASFVIGGDNTPTWAQAVALGMVQTNSQPSSSYTPFCPSSDVIRLTDNHPNENTSVVFPNLNPDQPIQSFFSSFWVRLGGGSAGVQADGYSFIFSPPVGRGHGVDLFGEGGAGSGFSVSVPTYTYGTHDSIEVKWNGAVLAHQAASTFVSWTQWKISVDAGGDFFVQFGSNPAITGIVPGWTAADTTSWQFAVAARCGGSTEWVDLGQPFVITTVARWVPLAVVSQQGQLQVRWPEVAPSYRLYSSPLLGTGAVWTPVSNPATFHGNQWTVPIATGTNPVRFFRLQ